METEIFHPTLGLETFPGEVLREFTLSEHLNVILLRKMIKKALKEVHDTTRSLNLCLVGIAQTLETS